MLPGCSRRRNRWSRSASSSRRSAAARSCWPAAWWGAYSRRGGAGDGREAFQLGREAVTWSFLSAGAVDQPVGEAGYWVGGEAGWQCVADGCSAVSGAGVGQRRLVALLGDEGEAACLWEDPEGRVVGERDEWPGERSDVGQCCSIDLTLIVRPPPAASSKVAALPPLPHGRFRSPDAAATSHSFSNNPNPQERRHEHHQQHQPDRGPRSRSRLDRAGLRADRAA